MGLDAEQRAAAAVFGGDECSWPPVSNDWPAWDALTDDHRAAATVLRMDESSWPPSFWADIVEVTTILHECGASAILM